MTNGLVMSDQKFLPFYERIANRCGGEIVGRVVVSTLLGLAFLVPHYLGSWLVGKNVNDWSWFLGVLITTAMLCLYYATHTLETLFTEMNTRLGPKREDVYMPPIKEKLSDAKFIIAGIFFGSLNCGVGYLLGLPYLECPGVVTILIGYFLAGFVCGMAVLGIYGVFAPIKAYSVNARPSFDFTSPDHCGGTGFLGNALIVFGSVTLIVGVMISVYILKTHWKRTHTWWVILIEGIWIIFPYICSLLALIAPAVPVNKQLRAYKIEEEIIIKKRLTQIQKALENQGGTPADRKDLREDYEFQQNRRKDLHGMRTWPFALGAGLKYLSVVVVNLIAHVSAGAAKWLSAAIPS
jgi:hypothetical protein